MTTISFAISLNGDMISGRSVEPGATDRPARKLPLVIALHGGSYSSAYFDISDFSLLDRAASEGCMAIALDRPGYGGSTLLEAPEDALAANADRLDAAIAQIWQENRNVASGVVLVGHSIGGAIATIIAGRELSWPLLGIAISGIGMVFPAGGPPVGGAEVVAERIDVPAELKNLMMFGPQGTYEPDAPAKAAAANEPMVLREIIGINTIWPARAAEWCARVTVPVHYRQGDLDPVWSRKAADFDLFRSAFSNAPRVDAELVQGAGHCIDFHLPGPAFQQSQIAFAKGCI